MPAVPCEMEPMFIFLTIIGIILEIIGIFGVIRERLKDRAQSHALTFLMSGFACHGIAFLISYIA